MSQDHPAQEQCVNFPAMRFLQRNTKVPFSTRDNKFARFISVNLTSSLNKLKVFSMLLIHTIFFLSDCFTLRCYFWRMSVQVGARRCEMVVLEGWRFENYFWVIGFLSFLDSDRTITNRKALSKYKKVKNSEI